MILDVADLTVRFPIERGLIRRTRGWVHAVDALTLAIAPRETVALVGESGSGKTTAGRAILRLIDSTSARHRIGGEDWRALSREPLRRARWRAQMVFQDPAGSLSPRRTVRDIVDAPRQLFPRADAPTTDELLARVGLGPELHARAPAALSGGQRQRVAIARALATSPQLVILDEALSSLDASIAAQMLNLLASLRDERGLAYLFIAHDLGAVRWLADRVAVMYLGRIVEQAPRAQLFARPAHPYTRALLAAAPTIERPQLPAPLPGEPPSPLDPPRGCPFHPRCALAQAKNDPRCREERPPLSEIAPGHAAACHFAAEAP